MEAGFRSEVTRGNAAFWKSVFMNSDIVRSRVNRDVRGLLAIKFIIKPPYHAAFL